MTSGSDLRGHSIGRDHDVDGATEVAGENGSGRSMGRLTLDSGRVTRSAIWELRRTWDYLQIVGPTSPVLTRTR